MPYLNFDEVVGPRPNLQQVNQILMRQPCCPHPTGYIRVSPTQDGFLYPIINLSTKGVFTMPRYVYQDFDVIYNIKENKKLGIYCATGKIFSNHAGNTPVFQTEAFSRKEAEKEIKDLMNKYLDYEKKKYLEYESLSPKVK